MSILTAHKHPHRPDDEADELESGRLPVDPDQGPATPVVPNDAEDDGVAEPER